MEIINDSNKKVELTYPCSWSYKIIGYEQEIIEEAVNDIIDDRERSLTNSHNSKGGKYASMNLKLLVHNEDDRNFIYEKLKLHPNIKMVL